MSLYCSAVGCPAKFVSTRALSRHINKCDKVITGLGGVQRKRKAKASSDKMAKIRRMEVHAGEEEWGGINPNEGEILETRDIPSPEPLPAPPIPSPPPDTLTTGRPKRIRRAPRFLWDYAPSSLRGLPAHMHPPPVPAPPPRSPTPIPKPEQTLEIVAEDDMDTTLFRSKPNAFGLYREYNVQPLHDPEESKTLEDFLDPSSFPDLARMVDGAAPDFYRAVPSVDANGTVDMRLSSASTTASMISQSLDSDYAPLRNVSEFRLLHWQYMHKTSSNIAVNNLVQGVIQADDFSPHHFPPGFMIEGAQARLDKWSPASEAGSFFPLDDGWVETSVKIPVPKEGVRWSSEEDAPHFEVKGVLLRSLMDIWIDMYQSPASVEYHWLAHRMYWQPTSSHSDQTSQPEMRTVRVYTDIFNSDAMLDEEASIRAQPRDPDDSPDLEYAVGPLLLWSDSTHLANFGTASLWPIYAYSGSQSKHVAYIPKLPDSFQDWYEKSYGTAPTAAVIAFARRELYQAVCLLIIDRDPHFLQAYCEGFAMQCGDGNLHRMFPRFALWSMDYVEKILASCLKYFSKHPCPRCLILKEHLGEMGIRNDYYRRKPRIDNEDQWRHIQLARKLIFERGVPLTSVILQRILDSESLTPTRNALSSRLAEHGFNFYSLFVPDLMHEFELGVWKSTLTHLIRLLHAFGNDKVQLFNQRYRKVPTYGRDTIRRFVNNMADMKKMAARDFEDALQCSIPVFDGLPEDEEDNVIILDLLFDFGFWHCLAKLRLHTDDTLEVLDVVTIQVGSSVRKFMRVTCRKWETYELPKESAVRGRRAAARANQGHSSKTSAKKRKQYNLNTYKYHSLWDYAFSIRQTGPTDNTTTQVGELEHRHVKQFYARTNKNRHANQIAQHIVREEKIHKIAARLEPAKYPAANPHSPLRHESERPPLRSKGHDLPESPRERYTMANSERDYEDITYWVSGHGGDPAFKNFIARLKDHVLSRMDGSAYRGEEPEYSPEERKNIRFVKNRIYFHQTLRVNYTTYDIQRSQDVISPRSHPDVMVLAHEDDDAIDDPHPYWYARVIRIFHINVYRTVPGSNVNRTSIERMDVLWVRWFGLDPSEPYGFKAKRLPRIGFIPSDTNTNPFGFLDPSVVVHGAHVIPLFHLGHTDEYLPPSICRAGQNEHEDPEHYNEDYQFYNVNMFVDRDMFMRYLGGGVGHMGTGAQVETAFDDEDVQWQDIDPEVEDFEHEADESPDGDSDPPHYNASDNANGGIVIRSDEDVARLVEELGNASNRSGRSHSSVADDGTEAQEGDQEEDPDEADNPENEDAATLNELDNERDEDEYGQEEFAPL